MLGGKNKMEKRFRYKNGKLTMSISEIAKQTESEAAEYYRPGSIYRNAENGREYIYLIQFLVMESWHTSRALMDMTYLSRSTDLEHISLM